MKTKLYLLIVAIVVALVAAGCNKSSSTSPQTSQPPTFPSVTFKAPATNSTDSYATMTKSYATSINAYSSGALFAAFGGMNPAQNGNTWTWTITEGTLTVTYTMTKLADNSVTWQWMENGTDQSTGAVYHNWVFFSGSRSADGKSGDWKVFQDSTTNLAADFAWSTSATNVLTGTLKVYASNGTTITDQLTVINNGDGSGEVDVYTGAVVTFKATWVASGAGTWWTYNTSGTQTGTGTWT